MTDKQCANCVACNGQIIGKGRRVSFGGFLMDFHEACFVEKFGDVEPTDEKEPERVADA